MLKIYKTINDVTKEISTLEDGVWINMINPSQEELANIRLRYNIEESHLKAALDDEESPRIDVEDESTLFIIDVPIPFDDVTLEGSRIYGTVPIGIIIGEEAIITSSRRSLSSEYCFITSNLIIFSNTTSFAFREVVKYTSDFSSERSWSSSSFFIDL